MTVLRAEGDQTKIIICFGLFSPSSLKITFTSFSSEIIINITGIKLMGHILNQNKLWSSY